MSQAPFDSGRLVSRALHPTALRLPLPELFQSMGYPPSAEVSEEVRSAALEMSALAYQLMQPAFQYRILDVAGVDQSDSTLRLANGVELVGGGLLDSLESAEKIAVFLTTLGAPIVERIHSMIPTDTLRAYVLDTAASVAAEFLAEAVHLLVFREGQKNGFSISYRYSPGYCDWSLSEQQKIFSLLDPQGIGVRLTESFLMDPRKSISGVIGLGHDAARLSLSPCTTCKRPDCMARRGNFSLLGLVSMPS